MKSVYLTLLLGLAWLLGSTSTYAYSIDKVHTRVWIAPTGEVLVNEVMTYTFDGNPETIERSFSFMEDVELFEAFHITEGETTPGNIQPNNVMAFPVEKNGASWSITLPSLPSYEPQTFVYVYRLQEVVKTYSDYSQLTLPLYSKSYDEKLTDVTLDVVLPFEISPTRVHGFFDDRYGRIQEKSMLLWTFYTPESPLMSTTDIRLLFPSEGMTQPVTTSPYTFAQAVEVESDRIAEGQAKWAYQQQMLPFLKGLSTLLFLVLVFFVGYRFFKERQRQANPLEVMNTSPLTVAYIDPPERPTQLFLGGLYELVEQHKLRVTYDNGLVFHKTSSDTLTPAQQQLVDLLFEDTTTLVWNQAVTRIPLLPRGRVRRWRRVADQEKRQEFNFLRLPRRIAYVLQALSIFIVATFHYLDRSDTTMIVVMTGVALILIGLMVWLRSSLWVVSLNIFLLISIFLLEDPDVIQVAAVNILLISFLYFLLRWLSYSDQAWQARKDVRTFRQTLIYDSNFALSKEQVDRWLIRAFLLQTKKHPLYLPKVTETIEPEEAPLYHQLSLQDRFKNRR